MSDIGADGWRSLGLAAGGLAFVALGHALLGTERGIALVQRSRYLDWLSRRTKRLHLSVSAARIADAQVALAGALAVLALARPGPYALVAVALVLVGPAFAIERRVRARIAKLDAQSDGFCLALANALKTTPSVGAALDVASKLVEPPMREEIQLAVKETRLGASLGAALELVGPRAGSQKLATVLSAVLVGQRVGGNLPQVLDSTAATLREMSRLEGVVRQKTADGRMQMWALAIAPVLMIVAFHKLDPGYFVPLTSTWLGRVLAVAGMGSYAVGLVVAHKILQVDI